MKDIFEKGLEVCKKRGYRSLTLREYEAAYYAAHGLSILQISKAMGVQISTTRTQMNGAFWKLGVDSRARLVLKALTEGLVEPNKSLMVFERGYTKKEVGRDEEV